MIYGRINSTLITCLTFTSIKGIINIQAHIITCPSRRGLHKMLVLCNNFGNEKYIIFNTKKTLCVKYGEPVNDHEYIYIY